MNLIEKDYDSVASLLKHFGIMNKRLLITGSTGMIGSFIVAACLYGNRVYGLNNTIVALCRNREKMQSMLSADSSGLEIHTVANISDFDEDFITDYVIHTACNTSSSYMMSNPVETIDSIYGGTRSILEYARRVKPEKVIFLSSMEVYGEISNEVVVNEQSPLGDLAINNIRSGYPMAKKLSENMAVSYFSEYGVPVCILRLAQTFGIVTKPDSRYFYQLIEAAVDHRDITLRTKGDKINNFCYMTDAVRAMLYVLKHGVNGEVYNVSDRESTMTIKSMAEFVANEIAGGDIKVIVDIDEGVAAKYAKTSKYIMDSNKLCSLGWIPEVHIQEAFKRNVEYHKSL